MSSRSRPVRPSALATFVGVAWLPLGFLTVFVVLLTCALGALAGRTWAWASLAAAAASLLVSLRVAAPGWARRFLAFSVAESCRYCEPAANCRLRHALVSLNARCLLTSLVLAVARCRCQPPHRVPFTLLVLLQTPSPSCLTATARSLQQKMGPTSLVRSAACYSGRCRPCWRCGRRASPLLAAAAAVAVPRRLRAALGAALWGLRVLRARCPPRHAARADPHRGGLNLDHFHHAADAPSGVVARMPPRLARGEFLCRMPLLAAPC